MGSCGLGVVLVEFYVPIDTKGHFGDEVWLRKLLYYFFLLRWQYISMQFRTTCATESRHHTGPFNSNSGTHKVGTTLGHNKWVYRGYVIVARVDNTN